MAPGCVANVCVQPVHPRGIHTHARRALPAQHPARIARLARRRQQQLCAGQGTTWLPQSLAGKRMEAAIRSCNRIDPRQLRAGKLQDRLPEVQHVGRLLSTRHKPVQLAGRGRLLIPEGFREFLQIAAGGECAIIGAAVCIEIWNQPSGERTSKPNCRRFRRSSRSSSTSSLQSRIFAPPTNCRRIPARMCLVRLVPLKEPIAMPGMKTETR